jgi:hypothetical protein
MPDHRSLYAVLGAILLAPLLQGAASGQGEIVGDGMYVNCEYRMAAHFPSEPSIRDFVYNDGSRSAPARQFYLENGKDSMSVTVVHFANGPDYDKSFLDGASVPLRRKGDVKFEYNVFYDDPGIPGRQFSIALSDGRLLRASVYMAARRLYITEAAADRDNFVAFLFEQSVSLIDENGTDLDSNPVGVATSAVGTSAGLPNRQYDCSRINRRR